MYKPDEYAPKKLAYKILTVSNLEVCINISGLERRFFGFWGGGGGGVVGLAKME
jgi:hypothetical protein